MKYRACNWNMPNFGQVEVSIDKRSDNKSVASQVYTPNINIGNSASNSFSVPTQQIFEFDITEQDDYVIAFYSATSGWSDCIIGQLSIENVSYSVTDIKMVPDVKGEKSDVWYDLQGQRVDNNTPHKPGMYVSKGKKIYVR